MERVAALLILAAQVFLLWVCFAPSGWSSICFTFLGHPLLAVGVLFGSWALARRLRREAKHWTALRKRAT